MAMTIAGGLNMLAGLALEHRTARWDATSVRPSST
jgi:hypothetical protein